MILFYVKKPSRRYWHGQLWSPFREKRWIVLNPQFTDLKSRESYEFEEALTTAEFKKRLADTLIFLKNNQRPYWTNAVREHQAFLNTIRD